MVKTFRIEKDERCSLSVFEKLDLRVNVSVVHLVQAFQYVEHIVFSARWAANEFVNNEFVGGAALVTGIHIEYDHKAIFPGFAIKNNFDIAEITKEFESHTDGSGVKETYFHSELLFAEHGRKGFDVSGNKPFEVHVHDDLSARGISISMMVSGWKWCE